MPIDHRLARFEQMIEDYRALKKRQQLQLAPQDILFVPSKNES